MQKMVSDLEIEARIWQCFTEGSYWWRLSDISTKIDFGDFSYDEAGKRRVKAKLQHYRRKNYVDLLQIEGRGYMWMSTPTTKAAHELWKVENKRALENLEDRKNRK